MVTEYIKKERKFLNSEHMGAHAQVGEYRIHYFEQGQGEPLLLIHTIGQSLFTWHRVINDLADQYHVYAIDLLGEGYSDKPAEADYSIDGMAKLLTMFMDELKIKKAHICAFSMSAFYALRLAELYPERADKLVLITPGGVTPTMPSFISALENPLISWFMQWLINRRLVTNMLNECFFDQTKISEDMINEYYEPLRDKKTIKAIVQSLKAFDEEETIQDMRQIQHDTLLIWGIDDKWHELEIAELFRIAIKGVKLGIIRNCGHVVHEEKQKKFVDCAVNFLQGTDIADLDTED